MRKVFRYLFGSSRLRRIAWVLCLLGAVGAFAITFVLTEQAPQETTALSQSVERIVTSGAAGTAAGGVAVTAGGGNVIAALLSVANVRRWAHVPEFFVQGIFLFGAAALWPQARGQASGLRVRLGAALLACVACSLFDQAHKAFVPGREFDARDLIFDAMGYALALLVVVAVAGVRRLCRRRAGGGE